MSVIKVIPLCYLIRPDVKSPLHYDLVGLNTDDNKTRFFDYAQNDG